MATENTTLAFKVTTDTNAASGSVKSFKAQLRDATSELVTMSEKFGVTSTEAANAAKKVAGLKDAIGDAKALAETFNPDKKFVALGGALQGAVGGFSALQGAMGLFGSEGKEVEKIMLKVQSVMALQQGISGIMGAMDSFDLMKDSAIKAFQAIRAGIGSTGIGLFVLALGAIVMYWDDIKAAVSGVSDQQRKLNDIASENVRLNQEKLKHISDQDNILKLQGKTEKEILQYKINQANVTLTSLRAQLEAEVTSANMAVKASERNKDLLKGILEFITYPINKLLQSIDLVGKAFGKDFGLSKGFIDSLSTMVFNPLKVKTEGQATVDATVKTFDALKNELAGYNLEVEAIDKAAYDKQVEEQKKRDEAEKKRLKELEDFSKDLKDATRKNAIDGMDEAAKEMAFLASEEERQAALEKSYADAAILLRQQNTDKVLAEEKKKKDAESALSLKLAQEKKDHLNMVLNATDQVAGLIDAIAGRQTATSKALGIATATINMYQGASEVIRAKSTIPEPFGTIQKVASVAAILAMGIKQVKGIVGVKVPGGGGGGGSMPAAPTMPNAPLTPQAQSTRLDQGSINAIGQASARSYVLESDITSGQERIQRLNRAARIN